MVDDSGYTTKSSSGFSPAIEISYQTVPKRFLSFRTQSHGDFLGKNVSVTNQHNVSQEGTEYALEYGWINRKHLFNNSTGYIAASTGLSYFSGYDYTKSGNSWDIESSRYNRNAIGLPIELQAFVYPWQQHIGIGVITTTTLTQYSTFWSVLMAVQGRF